MIRILVVDDDLDFQQSLTLSLKEHGFHVTGVGSGNEAILQLEKENYDLVLLDFVMPGMDGIDTLVALKKMKPDLRFIMLTAFASIDNVVTVIKKGAHDYLPKPFVMDQLIGMIHRVIEEAKFEQESWDGDFDQAITALANPIRRKIVELLKSGQPMRMTDIGRKLGITDRTKVLFHLRNLKYADILKQEENRSYAISQTGKKLLDGLNSLKKQISPS
jgi:DNA-binding NtrC family response regulator